jgi:hypothetical protein
VNINDFCGLHLHGLLYSLSILSPRLLANDLRFQGCLLQDSVNGIKNLWAILTQLFITEYQIMIMVTVVQVLLSSNSRLIKTSGDLINVYVYQ